MKVSLNWIKDFTSVDIPNDQLMTRLSSQIGAVENIEYLGEKYSKAIIVKVAECMKHEGADKLSLCKIDDGGIYKDLERDDDGFIQVVCGAPNVTKDMLAVWLPPGSIVPSTFNEDPFVLESREIRGKISHGMLASPKELAFSGSHEGLLRVDLKVQPGTLFIDAYRLDDYIIDLENKMFTHRPDCFGILGIAREISGIEGKQFVSPEWYKEIVTIPEPTSSHHSFDIDNTISDLVQRFVAVEIGNVKIQPSPTILQSYLMRVGIRPINNIVDATNYMMMLTGQPMHAYDADKVRALCSGNELKIVIRKAKKDEKLVLLNSKEIQLLESDIVIATDKEVIGLAGVMGGASTEVDSSTKNILLECASFDMYSIRRTSMEHGIFSDAVTRFNKGQSPRQNMAVLVRAIKLMKDISGGDQTSIVIDNSHINNQNNPIKITPEFVNSRLGTSLRKEDMIKFLSDVEIIVSSEDEEIIVTSPFWRTDLEIKEDIVEEIGRLNGFFKLDKQLPVRDIHPAKINRELNIQKKLRETLSSSGANEVILSSFVHGDILKKSNQSTDNALQIANALSPDLQYYRLSLTPGLLDIVYSNIRSNQGAGESNEFALFEIGKCHNLNDLDNEKLPVEYKSLSFVFSADSKTAKKKYKGAPYFQARKYLTNLISKNQVSVKIVTVSSVMDKINSNIRLSAMIAAYDIDRSAAIVNNNNEIVGIVGEFKFNTRKSFKLPDFTAGFEIDLGIFNDSLNKAKYIPLPKFPKINQDLCFRVKSNISYSQLFEATWDAVEEFKPHDTFSNINLLDIYQKENDTDYKQVTFRLLISAYDRTLTTDLVNELVSKVANKLNQILGSELI
jgi:phenylalanyl-tRNA synthetase beta chain